LSVIVKTPFVAEGRPAMALAERFVTVKGGVWLKPWASIHSDPYVVPSGKESAIKVYWLMPVWTPAKTAKETPFAFVGSGIS
jgi:hypothetical protein